MTPEEANALNLGQPVRFTQVLHRTTGDPKDTRLTKVWTRWKYLPDWSAPRSEHLDGIVVGLRTLANGHLEWLGWDEGHVFRRTGSQQAVLVAWHKRRKPVLVAPEDLELVPGSIQARAKAVADLVEAGIVHLPLEGLPS